MSLPLNGRERLHPGIIIARINGDMKARKTHKIVSAYSALATVALGLVAFDAIDRRESSPAGRVVSRGSGSESAVASMIGSVTRYAGNYWASLAAK